MLSNFCALIGEFVIPRLGVVDIEEMGTGYRIRGHVDNEQDKLEILRNLGPIRRGRVERAKFVTRQGTLVNENFTVTESRFEEEQLPDRRRFVFTILLEQPNAKVEMKN
jgi:hypothetical protein